MKNSKVLVCLMITAAAGITHAASHREAFRKVIQKNISEIKNCYTEHLKTDSGASGKIVMYFEINPQGEMVSSKVNTEKSRWLSNAGRGQETPSLNAMADCIGVKLGPVKFPAAHDKKAYQIEYPFVFGPR